MKTKILIVEEDYYKYFTVKQLLESQLHLKIVVQKAESSQEVIDQTSEIAPSILIYRPLGGVVEVLDKLKEKGINRRNAVVTILLTQELEPMVCRRMYEVAHKKPARHLPHVANAA